MPNPDLKNTPLFVFVRRQGERVVHYSRKVSDATGHRGAGTAVRPVDAWHRGVHHARRVAVRCAAVESDDCGYGGACSVWRAGFRGDNSADLESV